MSCTAHDNSHSATEKWLGLTPRAIGNEYEWAKVEVSPSKGPLDFDDYKFKLDEERRPDWFADEHELRAWNFAVKEARELIKIDEHNRITHWPGNVTPALLNAFGELSALTTVGGSLYCSGNKAVDKLTTIGGYLDCSGNKAATFDKLTTIGGYLYCREATATFDKLTTIGGSLDCREATATFDKLTTIGGYLDCSGNKAATFDKLKKVNGRAWKDTRKAAK